jgi:SsrA-binding protein
MKVLVDNKKVYFDFTIEQELQAGMVLSGSEVKSLKSGQGSLKGAYVVVRNEEVFLTHAYISPYAYAPNKNYNPERDRKLLLKKSEISALIGKQKGMVLMPLLIYENRGLVKLKIGLGFGKKKFDKREAIKKRDTDRQIRRHLDL